jgi:hypothetical protein
VYLQAFAYSFFIIPSLPLHNLKIDKNVYSVEIFLFFVVNIQAEENKIHSVFTIQHLFSENIAEKKALNLF